MKKILLIFSIVVSCSHYQANSNISSVSTLESTEESYILEPIHRLRESTCLDVSLRDIWSEQDTTESLLNQIQSSLQIKINNQISQDIDATFLLQGGVTYRYDESNHFIGTHPASLMICLIISDEDLDNIEVSFFNTRNDTFIYTHSGH